MDIEKTLLQKLISAVKNGFDFTGSDITVQDLKDMKEWMVDRWDTEWLIAGFHDEVPSANWVAESEETLLQLNAEIAVRNLG